MKDRRVLTKSFAAEYRQAGSKRSRTEILDRFVSMTDYNRCYAARLLRGHGSRTQWPEKGVVFQGDASRPAVRRPARRYGEDVRRALVRVWEILDFMCGKRLAPGLPAALERLERFGELTLAGSTRELLCRISPATIDRLLAQERARHRLRGRSLTKPGTLLKREIPLRSAADWRSEEPGFAEADLVAHEGGCPSGDFACTLDVVDSATGWTCLRAVLNKAQVWVLEAMQEVVGRMPFPLRGICCDNGSEFINKHLKKFCDGRAILFCRTRPGRKNDNCRVEERNWSMARQAAGYARYSGEEAVRLLNELYEPYCLRANFFKPCARLASKTRVGSAVKRQWDKPRTPVERLLDSPLLDEEAKAQLRRLWENLNPAELDRRVRGVSQALLTVCGGGGRGLQKTKACDSAGEAAEGG